MKLKSTVFIFLLFVSQTFAVTREQVWGNALPYFLGWRPLIDSCWILDVNGDTIPPLFKSYFKIGSWNIGAAYCWGGWDTAEAFSSRISSSVCPGGYNTSQYGTRPDGTSNARYYLTGIDCAAFVNRCLRLPFGQGIPGIRNCCLRIDPTKVRRGDILLLPHHAALAIAPPIGNQVDTYESESEWPKEPKVQADYRSLLTYISYSIFPQFGNETPANDGEVYEKRPGISVEITGSGVIDVVYMLVDGKSVSFTTELIQDGKRIKHIPQEDLEDGDHTVEIRATNNRVNLYEDDYTWSFRVFAECPVVISTDPKDKEKNVDILKKMVITFSKEMNRSTVNASTILFDPHLHGSFTTQWDGESKVVTLTVTDTQEDFEYSTDYTVTVTDGVRDKDNVQLDGDKNHIPGGDYIFSFTTREPRVDFYAGPWFHNMPLKSARTSSGIIKSHEPRSLQIGLTATASSAGGWTSTLLTNAVNLNPRELKTFDLVRVVNTGGTTPYWVKTNADVAGKGKKYVMVRATVQKEGEKQPDDPDENQQIINPIYPTPWFVDADSRIGILVSGSFMGLGHLLGRFKIATVPVGTDLIVWGKEQPIDSLRVLIIPTGGLFGLDGNLPFKEGIKRFVENGGTIICLTQQQGYEFSCLPTPPIGYGWRQDNSCFANSGYLSDWHVCLSGQDTVLLDAGLDGFFARLPDGAQILMKRRATGMPELAIYDYGRGKVVVSGAYSDWAYGRETPGVKSLHST